MMDDQIPDLQSTSLETIPSRISTTRNIEFRLIQLRKLYWAYVVNLTEHSS